MSRKARATGCALRVGRRSGSGPGRCRKSSGSIGKTALVEAVASVSRITTGTDKERQVEMPGLVNWIRASRQRKRERWEAEHGHLSEQEKFVADEYQPGREPAAYPTKGFDEQSRGRPGK